MFTGIIERIGAVAAIAEEGGSRCLSIVTGFCDLALGESVAVDGVCLTVARLAGANADFFVSPETIGRSTLGRLRQGAAVNLERSATLSTPLSGHLVQGHVDGRARLVRVDAAGDARRIELSVPATLRRYCVEKGSIALNGVSLTLNGVGEPREGGFAIAIMLIPHTWTHTNLQRCAVGDDLNIEVDVLAKYVESLCRPYPTPFGG